MVIAGLFLRDKISPDFKYCIIILHFFVFVHSKFKFFCNFSHFFIK